MNELLDLAETRVASRDQIVRLEQAMMQHAAAGGEVLDPHLRHYFAPGLYARECFVPAGAVVTGRIHLSPCLNVVLGDITVYSPGEPGRRISGMETFRSEAGTKRAVYAHTDTWWTTFHPNPDNETDIPSLERRFVVDSFDALDNELAARALLGNMR